jgi:hypothetical protein
MSELTAKWEKNFVKLNKRMWSNELQMFYISIPQLQYDKLVSDQSQFAAVTSERDKYRDMVNEGTRDIMLNEFNMRGAHFEIELHHPVFSVVAIQAAQYLTEKKADNYVEMKVWTKEHGDVTITVQKCKGKTPHELRKEVEQERDALKAKLEEANADAETLATSRDGNDGKLYCRHCDGWGYDFEGEINVDHKQDCPVKSYRARLAKDES